MFMPKRRSSCGTEPESMELLEIGLKSGLITMSGVAKVTSSQSIKFDGATTGRYGWPILSALEGPIIRSDTASLR